MATIETCDCGAMYEVSSFLLGHTFACNKCGRRIVIGHSKHFEPDPREGKKGVGANREEPSSVVHIVLLVLLLVIVISYFSCRS